MREHLDSQLTQWTLVRRAQSLGWHPERIQVFDGDLGQRPRACRSATRLKRSPRTSRWAMWVLCLAGRVAPGSQQRRVVSAPGLAALVGTLIGDTDGVYDLRLYNDRLLLGLKGTMSEAELYLMRQRLNAGRLSKVHRGEYVQRLRTGLVRLADHRVIKDPDRQIQHVIALVFTKFEEIGSGYGVIAVRQAA